MSDVSTTELTEAERLNAEFDKMATDGTSAALMPYDPGKPPDVATKHRAAGAKRKRQVAFLKSLSLCGLVSRACEKVGINVTTEQNWRTANDAWYNARFNEAIRYFRDTIEEEVHSRAINGVEVPIIGKKQVQIGTDFAGNPIFGPEDRVIATKVVKSDLLLMFHAKRHIPEYKDGYVSKAESESIAGPKVNDSPLVRIRLRLEMIGERQKQAELRNITPQLQITAGVDTQKGATPNDVIESDDGDND